jgi:hypothetical protein
VRLRVGELGPLRSWPRPLDDGVDADWRAAESWPGRLSEGSAVPFISRHAAVAQRQRARRERPPS